MAGKFASIMFRALLSKKFKNNCKFYRIILFDMYINYLYHLFNFNLNLIRMHLD